MLPVTQLPPGSSIIDFWGRFFRTLIPDIGHLFSFFLRIDLHGARRFFGWFIGMILPCFNPRSHEASRSSGFCTLWLVPGQSQLHFPPTTPLPLFLSQTICLVSNLFYLICSFLLYQLRPASGFHLIYIDCPHLQLCAGNPTLRPTQASHNPNNNYSEIKPEKGSGGVTCTPRNAFLASNRP